MQTGSGHIRPATPDEAPTLTDIAKRAKAQWGYSQELLETWSDDLTISPKSCDGHSLWVLEIDDIIVGFGEILIDGETALLDDLWIQPGYMGTGFGTRLFQFLKILATERGANVLRIESDPNASGFYERMGAHIVGEIASESVPDRTLPLMELDLSSPENTTIHTE